MSSTIEQLKRTTKDGRAPATYRHVTVTKLGGPEVLQILEDELPEPGLGAVRVRILATGLSLPDLLMREGVHPEKHRPPFTPGWDLVGIVDQLGPGATGPKPGEMVAALPIVGAHAEYICLPQDELSVVPAGVDPAEAVCVVFNYVTAYQMMHRTARVRPGQRVLIHAAAGGIGTALLQLGRLAGLEMYGTASLRAHETVRSLGGVPIDYRAVDFVEEVRRLTGDGVDVVFDGIGGAHIWRSRKALRAGGKVVAYGLTSTLRAGNLPGGWRHRLRGLERLRSLGIIGLAIADGFFLPGRKRVLPYSIQWLKRRKPVWFREDLTTLLRLLSEEKIKPIIAARFPLQEIRQAHELLGAGGVTGKIVLLC
jgi:NADPH:quinone reductase-like Zn-dependent oxidoreductase